MEIIEIFKREGFTLKELLQAITLAGSFCLLLESLFLFAWLASQ